MASSEVIVGRKWEAVGPFPSGMREHPLTTSPLSAFVKDPLLDPDVNFARKKYDAEETWPSELAVGGRAGWAAFEVGDDGWVNVAYPDIPWDQLRSDHGWASLQYQTILRTSLTVPAIDKSRLTAIRIELIEGVEFALISSDAEAHGATTWYAGDMYDFAESPAGQTDLQSRTSNLARSLAVVPGEYTLLVRAVYEIRLFGDPGSGQTPTIRLKIQAEVDQSAQETAVLLPGTAIVPDVLEGWLLGGWVSVGIRVPANGNEVSVIGVENDFNTNITSELVRPVRIAPGQTRPIALRIVQNGPLSSCVKSLAVQLRISVNGEESILTWHPTLKQDSLGDGTPIRITFTSSSSPSSPPARIAQAILVPPPSGASASPSDTGLSQTQAPIPPVLLALHGAGVSLSDFWTDAIPRLRGYWAVLPEGGTEWGEDWHGGSMRDAWAARDAVNYLLGKLNVGVSKETILIGHSNGGQGAWHLAARYPDRIVGLIVASGYLSIQHYVPYTELTSNHYADPALLGILNSSLTPYQNDLYASNLSDIPILVIHGSDDDNVPARHSRVHLALVSAWAGSSDNLKYLEVPKKGHWWEDVIKSETVVQFIQELPGRKSWDEQRRQGFTITTANPQESSGRAGIRILELATPGRLARLDVNARQWRNENPSEPLDLRGTNIKRIELVSAAESRVQTLIKDQHREWKSSPHPVQPPRAYGPIIRVLSTSNLITIIVPTSSHLRHISIAKRIANDLYLYHRLDSQIVGDQEALERLAREQLGEGNLIVIGRPEENRFAEWTIRQKRIPVTFPTKGVILLDDKVVYDKGAGIITLHPHPTSDKTLSLLIAGNDESGLELAARLFPIRTGVPIPDWAVISPRSRWQAAGGLIGAGFWNDHWGWSEAMSWTDR